MNKNITKYLLLILGVITSINTRAQEILTMERALEIAALNSPTMQQSQLSLENSRERLNAQHARLKSQFALTLNPLEYGKTYRLDQTTNEKFLKETATSSGTFSINQKVLPTDGTISLRNTFSYDYNYSESSRAVEPTTRNFNNHLNIALSQPIFTYNKTKVQLESMELNYESSLLRYLLQKLNLEKNVAQQFYAVHLAQMRLNIAKEELKNNENSYEIIKNKVDGGLLALEELYQAEVNRASSYSSVNNAEISLQNTMDNFKVLVGMPLTDTFLIVANIIADSSQFDFSNAINYALQNRMELRQREISIENSMFNLLDAQTVNEFAGTITASFGMQTYNEELGNIMDNRTTTPTVGLSLQIPLFDWGERKSEIKAAEANLKSTEIDLETERIDIEVNIRSVLRNLENLRYQIEIQEKTVKNAELTYDINLERHLNGDLTSMDLGLYQDQLSNTKMSLTNAIVEYKLELLNLKIQTLYDFENQSPIIPKELLSNE